MKTSTCRGISLVEAIIAITIIGVVLGALSPRCSILRMFSFGQNAERTTIQTNLSELQKGFDNWVAMGGQRNGANASQIIQFLATEGTLGKSNRFAGSTDSLEQRNPARDDASNTGSWGTSLKVFVNTQSPPLPGFNDLNDGDGLFYYTSSGNRYHVECSPSGLWTSPELKAKGE